MQFNHCLTSMCTVPLLRVRNNEYLKTGDSTGWRRTIVCEGGILLLAVTSLVEVVAYGALMAVTSIVFPLMQRPCTFFAVLLDSSFSTFLWNLHNLWDNLRQPYLTPEAENYQQIGNKQR